MWHIHVVLSKKNLVWGLVANGRKFGINLQMWGTALQSECRICCPCAVCFLSTAGLVVGAVLLTLVPRVVNTLTSMCRGVLEKIIYCRNFFWSHLFALCKSECRMEKWMGVPRETETQMLMWCVFSEREIAAENTIFWVRKDGQNDVFLSFALMRWWNLLPCARSF